MIKLIQKRDGRIVDFKQEKIANAIWKAAKAVGGTDPELAKSISVRVVGEIETKFKDKIPTVENIQDIVEKVLIEGGHSRTAKAYIIYRKQHSDLRNLSFLFTSFEIIDSYVNQSDWRVKENSNMSYSLQGLNNHIASKLVENYWLSKLYPVNMQKKHRGGDIHIHDLGTLGPYCVGWDLKQLLTLGFKGVSGRIESKPANHFSTALGQIVNFFYTLQGEAAGAQAFSNFDTLLAPFVREDGLSYKEVKQNMQEFLFNVNVPTRVGFQTPFTNITMDLSVPNFMKDESVIIGGKPQAQKYGDYQKEMDNVNKAFAEVMLEGDAKGRPFTFPIPTYNITKDFEWDNPVLDPLWEMTAKYGIPYFSNFVNSDMKPEDARSMCCRLRLDNRELRKRGGGLFGANPLTGSIGVVTLNLPRVGYTSRNETEFYENIHGLMDLAKDSLEFKRKVIERFTDKGLYPYSKFYLGDVKSRFGQYWKNHFSTIGLLGLNEASINLIKEPITSKEGFKFASKTLDYMRETIGSYQAETGNIYNLEATPAEGTSYRLAMLDKKKYPDIISANEASYKKIGAPPYYTNSSHFPVNYSEDIFEVLDKQDILQTKYTGGTVLHVFLGERINSISSMKRLVKQIAYKYKLPYYTMSPTFSICPVHGYISGEHEFCPVCDEELGVKIKEVV